MRAFLLILLALSLPLAVGSGGGVVVQVIQDATRDVTWSWASGGLAVALPEVDIESTTFVLEPDALLIRHDVVDLARRSLGGDPDRGFTVSGRVESGGSFLVQASRLPGHGTYYSMGLWPPCDAPPCPPPATVELEGSWDEAASVVALRVPREHFASDLVGVASFAFVSEPIGGSAFKLADHAPDEGGVRVPLTAP